MAANETVSKFGFVQVPKENEPTSVAVEWEGKPASSYDWIGLFKSSEDSDKQYFTWDWITNLSNGQFSNQSMQNQPVMEARYFISDTKNGGYTSIKKASYKALTFVRTSTGTGDDQISVQWQWKMASRYDWIGLYTSEDATDDQYFTWGWVVNHENGTFYHRKMQNQPKMEARYFIKDPATKKYTCIQRASFEELTLDTLVYPNRDGIFAETPYVENKPSTGVCFSGGGSRAMVLAMGQLRGLQELNLMDNARYMSSVSGGTWASAVYNYKYTPDNADLLGKMLLPNQLTFATLKETPPPMAKPNITIGRSNTTKTISEFVVNYLSNVYRASQGEIQTNQVWLAAVGDTFLKPFQLLDDFGSDLFTLNQQTQEAFDARNPAFQKQGNTIFMPPSTNPYLIVNGVISNISISKANYPKHYIGLEFTPLYCGSPYQANEGIITYGKTQVAVDNGAIQSLAFGGVPESGVETDPSGTKSIQVIQPDAPIGLSAIAGVSSNFLGGLMSTELRTILDLVKLFGVEYLIKILGDFLSDIPIAKYIPELVEWLKNTDFTAELVEALTSPPVVSYWSPLGQKGIPTPAVFDLVDGRTMDNYGIMPMLRRQMAQVVVFINTNQSLDTKAPENYASLPPDFMDYTLTSLFGCLKQDFFSKLGVDLSHNFVLEPYLKGGAPQGINTFQEVIENLQKAKENKETVMTTTTHTVKTNEWWGISGKQFGNNKPYTVEVCWVYNEIVESWETQLPDDVQKELHLGNYRPSDGVKGQPAAEDLAAIQDNWNVPAMNDFPMFNTVTCTLQGFTPIEANCLAQLGSWNVAGSEKNRNAMKSILRSS